MLSVEGQRLVNEAKSKAMWIYDPSYKRWYTPEDIAHIFTYANADDLFLGQVQIRHPLEGIQAGFKMLANTQTKPELFNRLEIFTRKVVDYYKK